jgi:hypothetical protein
MTVVERAVLSEHGFPAGSFELRAAGGRIDCAGVR